MNNAELETEHYSQMNSTNVVQIDVLASWWGCHISVACGGLLFPTFTEETSVNVFK